MVIPSIDMVANWFSTIAKEFSIFSHPSLKLVQPWKEPMLAVIATRMTITSHARAIDAPQMASLRQQSTHDL